MISVIACQDINGSIGYENNLIFRLRGDMEFFKNATIGKSVAMGRKTFESIGSKPLKDRYNIVISRTMDRDKHENVVVVRSIQEALDLFTNEDEIFFIGGESLYSEAMNHPDFNRAYITTVFHSVSHADTIFPAIPVEMKAVYTDTFQEEVNKENITYVTSILEKV